MDQDMDQKEEEQQGDQEKRSDTKEERAAAAEPKRKRRARPGRRASTMLTTQQIRPAMAEIRALCGQRTVPFLSYQLTTVRMTVADFCFMVTLQNHKKRTVSN